MAYYFYRLFEVDMNTPIGKKLITDDVIITGINIIMKNIK